ncbi:MAG: DUF4476 domain-containing protein [Flavobacteriales bacterium]
MRAIISTLFLIVSFSFALQAASGCPPSRHGRWTGVVRKVPAPAGNNCRQSMSVEAFGSAKKKIEDLSFEAGRLAMAKQVGASNCLTTRQVMEVLDLFNFEDSRLDFAKFAYDHVTDTGNYYQVSAKLKFSGSVETLNSYLQTR